MTKIKESTTASIKTTIPVIEPPGEEHELKMSLLDHLDELRIRLFRAALSLIIGVAIGIPMAGPLLKYLQEPYGDRFQALDPTNPVVSYFRVALLIGAIITIPLTTYQVLMFVLPGLLPREKRVLFMSLPAVTGLFLIGALFSLSLIHI